MGTGRGRKKKQCEKGGEVPFLLSPIPLLVRSLSAKYRPDRYRRDKSVKFGTELP